MEHLIDELELQTYSQNPFVIAAMSGLKISILDTKGDIQWANNEFCQVTEYSLDELKGRSFSSLGASTNHTAHQELNEALYKNTRWEGELKNLTKSGQLYWLKTNAIPVHDSQCLGLYYITLSTNITRTKTAEEERAAAVKQVLQSENRYHAIVNDQTDMFCVFDKDGIRTYVNETYCTFFGTSPQQILGTSILTHNPFYIDGSGIEQAKQMSPEQPQVVIFYEMKNAQNKTRFIVWRLLAFFDQSGNKTETLAFGRDITEIKNAERQKNNYTAALEKIAFLTSHKVRGPIARSLGLLELLKLKGLHSATSEPLLKHFHTCIMELDNYTSELAQFIYINQSMNEHSIEEMQRNFPMHQVHTSNTSFMKNGKAGKG